MLLKSANPAMSPSPWFVYPMGVLLQGTLPSGEEPEGPHNLNPITLG